MPRSRTRNNPTPRDNYIVRFQKNHPVWSFIIPIFIGFLGGLLLLVLPNGVNDLNHFGIHFFWIPFSDFKFNFQNFETEYVKFQNSTQSIIIENKYDGRLHPRLEVSIYPDPRGEIKIVNCVEETTNNSCNNGFPISGKDFVILNIDLQINFPDQNKYKLKFKVMNDNNYNINKKVINIR